MDDPEGQRFGLAQVQLTDKPIFDAVFGNLAQPISDYTFANTFIWSTSLKLYWARMDRHLCVFANGTGDLTMLMPPMPEPGAADADLRDCVVNCFDLMDRYNDRASDRSRSRIEYVSDEMMERLSAVRELQLAAAPFSGDYIYDMQKMIDLDGGKLKSKRHSRSKFMRDYPDHRTETLAEHHVPACLELLHQWRNHGDASHLGEVNEDHVGSDILRQRDTLACEMALKTVRELNLTGMALFVGERLVGFTLGEPISPTQVSIVIEKTDPAYYGSAQFIFSEFCRQHWSKWPECNVGDDWGIPSLRFTKSSYRPIRLLSKHTVTLHRSVVISTISRYEVSIVNPPHCVSDAETQPAAPLTLRRAELKDVDALAALEKVCFDRAEETFKRRQIRYLLGNPRATVMVGECDGEIAGWAVGLIRQHRKGRSGRLYAVAVRPDFQGRGFGRQLGQAIIDALHAGGIDRIYLEVRADNEPAIRLYRRMGFVDHRELPNYYGQGCHGRRMRLEAVRCATADSPGSAINTLADKPPVAPVANHFSII